MTAPPLPPASSLGEASSDGLRRALLDHYDRNARRLPWRGVSDPYRVLVSEVMLQQTRVETVQRFYGPWLERFPDVATLAAADGEEVLKAWEGLGYYRRARNLHAAAKMVRERPDRAIPSAYAELRALPGVGEYTAGAVASIAFGEVRPAVDGNVRRVLSRLFDVADPSAGWLRETAGELMDRDRPGDWNQGLMELGATVCTPRRPLCRDCPVRAWCAAHAVGTQLERPRAKRKSAAPSAFFAVGVFHVGGRVLLAKRPEQGLLGGMWALPERRIAAGGRAAGTVVATAAAGLGLDLGGVPDPLPTLEHRFTHLHAVYLPWSVQVRTRIEAARRVWIDPLVDGGPALPVAQRRILESWTER